MTILEALQWAQKKLSILKKETPSMLEAELLLAHALGVQKTWLFSNFSQPLQKQEQERFRHLIKRRQLHEPVAYLVGKKEFYQRTFLVNPFVLIPRPSTETLIEEALTLLKNLPKEETLCVDIGTGSGNIAITLVAETSFTTLATDRDSRALSVAKQNAKQHKVESSIQFCTGFLLDPVFSFLRSLQKKSLSFPQYILLCANLPYLREEQLLTMEKDVACYEPLNALFSGKDGLDDYWNLLRSFKEHQALFPKKCFFCLEIDPSQTQPIICLLHHFFPSISVQTKKDLEGHDRVLSFSVSS